MAASPTITSSYKIDVRFKCQGVDLRASSFSMSWGMNEIPSARVVLPLNITDEGKGEGVFTFKSSDPSKYALNPTLKAVNAVKNSGTGNTCDLGIKVDKLEGSGPNGFSLAVSGWRIKETSLEPQSRVSPGGVVVTIAHPIVDLTMSPGYFNPGTDDFMGDVFDAVDEADNVIEVADKTLDAIQKAMDSSEYKEAHRQMGAGEAKMQAEGAEMRISDYIDIGECTSLPYVHLFPKQDVARKACKRTLAQHFLKLPQNTPFDAFVSFCSQTGAYFRLGPKDKRAKLCILRPWKRDGSKKVFSDSSVYESTLTPDANPICGVRMQGMSVSESSPEASTLAGRRPVDTKRSVVKGDTVYYFQTHGKMLNMGPPDFAKRMVGMAAIVDAEEGSKDKASTTDSGGGTRHILSFDEFEKGLFDQLEKTAGGKDAAVNLLADIYDTTAETIFATWYKASARAVVATPALDGFDKLPEVGGLGQVSAGTGGATVTGVATHFELASTASGVGIVLRAHLGYADDPPSMAGTGEVPDNRVWG